MKKQQKYTLAEAIRKLDYPEPLKVDLAITVSEKLFVKQKATASSWDKWIYLFLMVLVACGIFYCFSLLNQVSLLYLFLLIPPVIFSFALSAKEYSLLLRSVYNEKLI